MRTYFEQEKRCRFGDTVFLISAWKQDIPNKPLQPQAFDVLDSGEDHIAAAFQNAGQLVYGFHNQFFHFLIGGSNRMHMKPALSRNTVNLRDGIILLQYRGSFH